MELLNDAIFLTRQYLYTHQFLIPLGVLGVWRWSVWLLKECVALFYRPKRTAYYASVSIVAPVYNEDPRLFFRALQSWQKEEPREIIAVIDYTDDKCIQVFKYFASRYPQSKLIITRIPGKRASLAMGIEAASGQIVALVDSDTIWADDTLSKGLSPFSDPKVAGVATYQNVSQPKTLAQKIFDLQLDLRYSDDFAFLATAGSALICLSGRTAFYRREIILPFLDDLVNETFWGEKVISGDDKRLTYLVLAKGYKVAYQSNSHVYTPGMASLSTYLKQRIRWSRNSLRADLRALWEGWPFKHPALVFFQFDKVIQAFAVVLSLVFFIVSLYFGYYLAATLILIWWLSSRAIKMLPHLKRRPQDITLLPFFVIYSFLTGVIKIYALFTLDTQGWITRWDKARLPRWRFLREVPAYAATILVLVFFIEGVILYRDYTYITPRNNQNKLIAEALAAPANSSSSSPLTTAEQIITKQQGLQTTRYEVKNGESLGSIAAKFNISLFDLLNANITRLTNWNEVEPGFILSIPGKDIRLTSSSNFNYQRIYPDIKRIVYTPSTNTIEVFGRGEEVTLSDLKSSVGERYLQEISPKNWFLNSNIFIHSGVTLKLSKDEVTWLKMKSSNTGYVYLLGYNATILIDGAQITSWDNESNNFDKNLEDGRSFILVKDGSRMDINDSELAYLGFPRASDMTMSTYGVSWRMSNGKLGTTLLTGQVTNSKFHHNYFGAYTFGATGMIWQRNEFSDNIRYGLDPHDDSNGFLVENNLSHNNGSHGIIFSKRCVNNIIRNNRSYNNKLHGIMLHEQSNSNLVENNTLTGNTDGIAFWNSSNNVVSSNNLSMNNQGFRANVTSKENLITNNQINYNKKHGVYLYSQADNNFITKNTLSGNTNAIYLKTKNNYLSGNTIQQNKIGIYILDNASGNNFISNNITYNNLYGIYLKTPQGGKNFTQDNQIRRNLRDIAIGPT